VADVYDTQGRLHGGTSSDMERACVARWWQHRQAGASTLLMAPTNDTVDRLNESCHRTRIAAGEIDSTGSHVDLREGWIYVGDEIATRANDRRLLTDRGEMVRNRATWTVDAVHPDASITATGRHGTVELSAGYVADHVELAYACTGAGAQGRTVQAGLVLIDKATDVRNVYVTMTRGREINEAFVVTNGEQRAVDVVGQCLASDWIDQPAITRQAELAGIKAHHPGLLDDDELRALIEHRREIETTLFFADHDTHSCPRDRREAEEHLTRADSDLVRFNAELSRAQDVIERYDRPLHRHRHERELFDARHDLVSLPREIEEATARAAGAVERIERSIVKLAAAREVLLAKPRLEADKHDIDAHLADDLMIRTRVITHAPPTAIVNRLGERPASGREAHAWDRVAGRLAQHHAAFGETEPDRVGLGQREASAYRNSRDEVEMLTRELSRTLGRGRHLAGPSLGR